MNALASFALDGFWLIGSLAVVYLIGVFTSQWAKDKLKGIPPELRSALSVTEASTLAELKAARDKVVADVTTLLSRGKAAAVAAALPTPPVPSPAATGPAPLPAPQAAGGPAPAAAPAPAA